MSSIKVFYMWWNKPQVVALFRSDPWQLTIRGINNSLRPPSTTLTAIDIPDLLALVSACENSEALSPIKVAILFGFFGFLRVSNLAPPKVSEWDYTRHTAWSDVTPSASGVLFSLKWSKSRQHAHHPVSIPLPALANSPLCPLTAWRAYVRTLPPPQSPPFCPLLMSPGLTSRIPITIPQIRAMFHRVAALAGLSDRGHTPHSLRRGGATSSYQAGVDLQSIKTHGTWVSDAVNFYLFAQPKFTTPVVNNFIKHLSKI